MSSDVDHLCPPRAIARISYWLRSADVRSDLAWRAPFVQTHRHGILGSDDVGGRARAAHDEDAERDGDQRARGHQRLASAERHDPVADPVDLSDSQGVVSAELLADRPDRADAAVDGLAAAAGGRDVHRSAADAVLARRRHGVFARRLDAVVGRRYAGDDPAGGRPRRSRLLGLPSGIVSHRAHGFWRTARPRPVGLSGWRQSRFVARAAARRVRRRAARAGEPGLVRADCGRRDGAAAAGRPLVGASPAAGDASRAVSLDGSRERACRAAASSAHCWCWQC